MRVLVTGANGFTGRWMLREIERHSATAIGFSRKPPPGERRQWLAVDLLDAEGTMRAVESAEANAVVHLASRTPANSDGIADLQWIHEAATATLNLLDAVRQCGLQARTLLVSSSAVYGHVPAQRMPITEDIVLKPSTIYGVTKATQELIANRFFGEFRLPVIVARPFNVIGVGEPGTMLTSRLASQIAEAKRNAARATISLRHRVTQRDYTDVRDVVRAYWMLLETGRAGETYNVCSGQARSIGAILDELLELAGVDADIRETLGGPEPGDILIQQGSHDRLTNATGWRPEYGFRESLRSLLVHAAHESANEA